jgi:hypothetical protein
MIWRLKMQSEFGRHGHRLTDAHLGSRRTATTGDTLTTAHSCLTLPGRASACLTKCRMCHPYDIRREITPRGVRPYKSEVS